MTACKNCGKDTPQRNVTFKINDTFCGEDCRMVYGMKKAKYETKKNKIMVVVN